MRWFFQMSLLVVTAAICGCNRDAPVDAQTDGMAEPPLPQTFQLKRFDVVYEIEFGLINDQEGVEVEEMVESVVGNRIPFKPGSKYGLLIKFWDPPEDLWMRTVLSLPLASKWTFVDEADPTDPDQPLQEGQEGLNHSEEQVRVQENGNKIQADILVSELKAEEGQVVTHLSSYQILQTDPLGKYKLQLFLNQKFEQTVNFSLVEMPDGLITMVFPD